MRAASLPTLLHDLSPDRIHAAGQRVEWVVDPSFAQAFAVACPTPAYAELLSAIPPVLVAPLPRLVRALLLLGAELARCFEGRGLPLPPWRSVDALASKYDAVSSVAVHASGGVAPRAAEEAAAVSAGGPRAAAPAVAAAFVERKLQHDQLQLQRVQLHLVRMGLLEPRQQQQRQEPNEAEQASSSGSCSPCSSSAGASPRSVLTGSQAAAAGASSRQLERSQEKASRAAPLRQQRIAGFLADQARLPTKAASAA